jgi:hypothetical protein
MTTAGLLVFVAAAVAWILRSGTGRNGRLLIPVALLLLFSLNCRVQIGIRLVFPLLVLAYLCGAVWLAECWQRGSRWIRVAVCLALAAHAAESALAYPRGLMFANAAWSTFAAPDYLMSDSNYDWGQGLPDLEQEGVEQARTGPIDLVYFGADPAANDVSRFRRLGCYRGPWPAFGACIRTVPVGNRRTAAAKSGLHAVDNLSKRPCEVSGLGTIRRFRYIIAGVIFLPFGTECENSSLGRTLFS